MSKGTRVALSRAVACGRNRKTKRLAMMADDKPWAWQRGSAAAKVSRAREGWRARRAKAKHDGVKKTHAAYANGRLGARARLWPRRATTGRGNDQRREQRKEKKSGRGQGRAHGRRARAQSQRVCWHYCCIGTSRRTAARRGGRRLLAAAAISCARPYRHLHPRTTSDCVARPHAAFPAFSPPSIAVAGLWSSSRSTSSTSISSSRVVARCQAGAW